MASSAPALPHGATLDYPDVAPTVLQPEFLRLVADSLRSHGIVLLHKFPYDSAALVALARRFGLPQRLLLSREKVAGHDPRNWVTDVRFRADIPETDRFDFVEGTQQLGLHTARATAAVQPQLLLMYMADPGERGADKADQGQSWFARLDDALHQLAVDHGPGRADKMVETLANTAFQPIDARRPYPFVGSVLARKDNGCWKLRYWEFIARQAEGNAPPALAAAIVALDAALNHESVRHEIALDAGDLVLLDNERVAHGRRAFSAWGVGPGGERIPSARHIMNLKVFSELEVVG